MPDRVIDDYLQQWSLVADGPTVVGNHAVVQPVRTEDGTPAVLRAGDPAGDSAQDWLALRLWDGDGAVRMYNYDAERDVTLLERLDHTRNLDVLPIDEAVVIAGSLRTRLSGPAPGGLPTSSRWPRHGNASSAPRPACRPTSGTGPPGCVTSSAQGPGVIWSWQICTTAMCRPLVESRGW